jgi:hypothetical protein
VLRSALDESHWLRVEDDCITSGFVPYNHEDEYCVAPNGEVYLKCGGRASEGVDGSCTVFKGQGSDADQNCSIGATAVPFQRITVTAPATSHRRSQRLQVNYGNLTVLHIQVIG